jgi:hypothetical protein
MSGLMKSLVLAAGVVLGSVGWLAPARSYAQFRVPPKRNSYYQGMVNTGISRYAAGYSPRSYGLGGRAGYRGGNFYARPISQPYYNTNGYAPPQDSYGGYLEGAASAIKAQGEFKIQEQQVKITKEQANQAKLETRRKSFDQYLYERNKRPTIEDDREKARLERVRRARNKPPLNEIWSGYALNTLLDAIQKMHTQRIAGPTVPLEPESLQRINVSTGVNEANLGVLKDAGRLRWPLTLRTSPYKTERQRLDKLASQAYSQASRGSVEADTIMDMSQSVDKLYAKLKRNISKVSANDYIKSKRYLNELEKSVKMLDDPNVGNFATRKWSAQGDNVGALVMNMTQQGLRFASATQGDEAAYTALHSAMVAYYTQPGSGQPWDPAAK